MGVDYIGTGQPDGTALGRSDDKLSMFGATPVVQQSVTADTITTTGAVSTTSNIWGFSTSTQANEIVTAVSEILAALANVGIVAE